MKSEVLWTATIAEKDGLPTVVHDIAYSPDGTQILVAVDTRILVYQAANAEAVTLRGHKDTVYAVAYSKDGKRFASGSADKVVIIWQQKPEGVTGILKYTHNDSVQCLAYNPVTQQLASGTASDFGLWSPEQKSVQKFKVTGKVLSASWTSDGQFLALGQMNGHISIRDKQGNEKLRVTRNSPVWSLRWSPVPKSGSGNELLAVGCWDQTLSFYKLNGEQEGGDVPLGYDPCSIDYVEDGEFMLVGGSDKKVSLYNKQGIFLKVVAELHDWVWAVKACSKQKRLVVGGEDGQISLLQFSFSTVHGLFQDRYAHRDNMTDVMIQHLVTGKRVRLRAHDYVKRIAVYRERLAIQLSDRVIIYETSNNDPNDMKYKQKEKIMQSMECNLLVVTGEHIVLCQERKLQSYSFTGVKQCEWVMDAVIRYIRVVGGPTGREGLLVGLRNGAVYKIFVDNRFPILLIKHKAPIRCLDLSASRKKLAVVDENSKVFIYDLLTGRVLYEDSNANSVAWNTELEDMLCFSGNNQLSIRTGDFPTHRQPLQGFVVGFKGSKIFCLHFLAMQTIDVPQSASLYQYLEHNDYQAAYRIACLGVTDSDWQQLGFAALQALNLDIARKAFIRVRDVRAIELLNRIEIARKKPGANDAVFLADILAYFGQHDEAAKLYCKHGQHKVAIEMYLDLRMWEKAKALVERYGGNAADLKVQEAVAAEENGGDLINMGQLLRRQAEWLRETNDMKSAANMYWSAKEYIPAITILGDNVWLDELIEKVRQLSKMQSKELALAASYFRKHGHHQYAKETYLKMDDIKSLLALHIELHHWDEAFALAKSRPEYASDIYGPYAAWLVEKDRFDEAQDAFKRAGRPEQSLRMLEQLTHNAVFENRFADVAYYHWLLAMQFLRLLKGEAKEENPASEGHYLRLFQHNLLKARLYYAYNIIYRYIDEPFTSTLPEAVFQTAQYILNNSSAEVLARDFGVNLNQAADMVPQGISLVYTLFALAKHGVNMQAFKTARTAYERLTHLKLPAAWREQVELSTLTIRTKPFADKDELLPVCYRCSATNPLLNIHGDACSNCGHPLFRSFVSFETLPLVEFFIENDITLEEAEKLIATPPPRRLGEPLIGQENDDGNAQTLRFDDDAESKLAKQSADDPFHERLLKLDTDGDGNPDPIVLDRKGLVACPRSEVFVVRYPGVSAELIAPRFFRTVIPDIAISMCPHCMHFFLQEDWDAYTLSKKCCPFCRTVIDEIGVAR